MKTLDKVNRYRADNLFESSYRLRNIVSNLRHEEYNLKVMRAKLESGNFSEFFHKSDLLAAIRDSIAQISWHKSDLIYYTRQALRHREDRKVRDRIPGIAPIFNRVTKDSIDSVVIESLEEKYFSKSPETGEIIQNIGIELECEGVRGGSSNWEFCRKVLNWIPGWDWKSDGSLDDTGIEWISPPVNPERGKAEFATLVKSLESVCDNSSSCGLHIHIGWDFDDANDIHDSPLTRERESSFLKILTDMCYDPKWELLLKGRRYNTYCCLSKSIRSECDRYKAVNLQAYREHKTIEIRIGGVPPQFSPEYVELVKEFIDLIVSHWSLKTVLPEEDPINGLAEAFHLAGIR